MMHWRPPYNEIHTHSSFFHGLLRRFFRFIPALDMTTDACWEWEGSVTSSGYGKLSAGHLPNKALAHRVVYLAMVGGIPLSPGAFKNDNLVLHHCDNKRCVRPSHLYRGTQHDNSLDCVQRHPRHAHIPKNPEKRIEYIQERTRETNRRRQRVRQAELDKTRGPGWMSHTCEGVAQRRQTIAMLVEQGFTNVQIAAFVGMSVKGVEAQAAASRKARNIRPVIKLTPALVRKIRQLKVEYPWLSQQDLAERFGVHRATIGRVLSGEAWKHIRETTRYKNLGSFSALATTGAARAPCLLISRPKNVLTINRL